MDTMRGSTIEARPREAARAAWRASVRKRALAILVVVLVVLLGGLIYAQATSHAGWKTVSGTRESGADRVEFELHYRGQEAVLIERRGDVIVYDARCTGTEFTERFDDAANAVVRRDLAPEDCFRFATGSLLGVAGVRKSPDYDLEGTVEVGGRAGEVWTRTSDATKVGVVLDSRTGLPLQATDPQGTTVYWSYTRMDVVSDGVVPPPGSASVGSPSVETYQDLSLDALAPTFGLTTLPESIGGLPFDTGFSYLGGELSGPTYYAIWSDATGRQVQLIRALASLPADTPTVEDIGGAVVLNLQEGSAHVQIQATDLALLREAVRALRPEALPALSQ